MEDKKIVKERYSAALGLINKLDDRLKSGVVSIQTPVVEHEGTEYCWVLSVFPLKKDHFLKLEDIVTQQLDKEALQSILIKHHKNLLVFFQAVLNDTEYFTSEVLPKLFLNFNSTFYHFSPLRILLLRLPKNQCITSVQTFEYIENVRKGIDYREDITLYLIEGALQVLCSKVYEEYERLFPGELKFLIKYEAITLEQAFRRAVNKSHRSDMESMVALGVNIDAKGPETGRTALHIACLNQNQGIAEYLLKLGANKEILDDYDKKPSDYGLKEVLEQGMGLKI